jgi:hypothetical protein
LNVSATLENNGMEDVKSDDKDLQPFSSIHHPLLISDFPKSEPAGRA